MGTRKDEKDLQDFLKKVNDVDSIVKGLTSHDPAIQAEAIAKADDKITSLEKSKKHSTTEIGFDRTSLNKNVLNSDDIPSPMFTDQHTSQDAFLAALEADSRKRAKARKERLQKASVVKEKGNAAFNDEEYELAVQFYTEAMTIAKDLTPLYTNRAYAYIKLEQFQNAINDCDFAKRIDEKWIKSYIYKATALQKLHQYDEAIKEFQKVLEFDKSKSTLVKNYLINLEKDKKKHFLELKTAESLHAEDQKFVNITKLIQTIKDRSETETAKANSSLMYFVGGFQVLKEHLVDDESKTVFRTKGGFDIFCGNGIVAKCLRTKYFNGDVLPHTVELASAFLSLCTAACSNMVENLEALLDMIDISELVVSFLEWPEAVVKQTAAQFFYEISLTAATRNVLYTFVDCLKLSSLLINPNASNNVITSNASAALRNLALDNRYFILLKKSLDDSFMNSIQECVKQIGKSSDEALGLRMAYIVQLVNDSNMCECLGADASFQKTCLNSLENCVAIFKSGLPNPYLMTELLHVLRCILKIWTCDENCQKIIGLLSSVLIKAKNNQLLSSSLNIVALVLELRKSCIEDLFLNQGYAFIKQLFECLKKDVSIRTFALKILCFAGQANTHYIHSYIKLDKNYTVLRNILLTDDCAEEVNQGHVALFLGFLSTISKGLDPILSVNAEGDIIRKMLVLCRESKIKQVSSNCAIALGKLAVCDTRFLIELREHDGINILSRLDTKDIIG